MLKREQSTIWDRYQKGRDYIAGKGLVDKTKMNWRFYLGDQWYGLESGGEILPTKPFIKPIVLYKVATICQNKMTATYSDLNAKDENKKIVEAMNMKFQANWEKADMNSLSWKLIKASAIQGDAYVYWYAPNKYQMLDNVSVLLGDEQNPNIQEQPYIIIRERVFVRDVKEIARQNGVPEEEIETIVTDKNNDYQLDQSTDIEYGNKDDGKVTSLIYFEKDENGIVWYGRCTENCMYQPMQSIKYLKGGKESGKGLSMYPIINFVWEDKPNSARGNSEVGPIIPNQIKVNQVEAQRAISVQQCAFPRLAYQSGGVANLDDLNKVGAAIEVNSGGAQSVNQMISYLEPAGLSAEGSNFSNELMTATRELAGASEVALGQIDPTRVSGSALSALMEQQGVNTSEQVNKFEKWVEDTARLWWEMAIVFDDSVEVEEVNEDTQEVITTTITPEQLEGIKQDVRVDVSQDTAYTKESVMLALDKLLESGQISLKEWADLLPQNSPLPKNELLALLKQREMQEPVMKEMEEGNELSEMQQ